ncbi:MAG: GNAT family N-acetyltransferase [Flavobacteriales bacterium]|nr:GNAT family N-acetyltransferase [Flavobacteriales bacterium]
MNLVLPDHETDRLRFRLLTSDDFEKWVPLFYEENVAKFLGMDTNKSPEEMCQLWFNKCFHRYENDLGGMNVLVDKNLGKIIGQCGILIQEVLDEQRYEIGYSILPEFWNKGYAKEASSYCLQKAFEMNLDDSIISVIHVDNIGSETVARNNGMTLEKFVPDYKGSPVNIFSIEKNNWKSR